MQNITKEIIIKASKGDMHAFEEIYRITGPFVFNIALRITGNREDAKDITQDVFIRVYRKLKGFMFKSAFKTWIYRIAANTAINAAKRIKKQRKGMTSYEDDKNTVKQSEAANQCVQQNLDPDFVDTLLAGLDVDQRACIVLRSIEGLSYKQISETLGVNINTVRTRLRRARGFIARKMVRTGGRYEMQEG